MNTQPGFSYQFSSGTVLEIYKGDITKAHVDAIVNAANSKLQHGGGVAAAIARRAGEVIIQESQKWIQEHGPVSHHQPAYTSAGKLPCRLIIHAVGPIWGEGDEDLKLAAAIQGCLTQAQKLGVRSLAFPAISTGIYGFPIERAATIFADVFVFALSPSTSVFSLIQMVLFDEPSYQAFINIFKSTFNIGSNQS